MADKVKDMTADQRVAQAARWLEPRIIQVKADMMSRARPGRTTVIRLVVPNRVLRLYVPHMAGKPVVSDTVRMLMKKHGVPAGFPAPVDGKRRSLVFVFRVRPTERTNGD